MLCVLGLLTLARAVPLCITRRQKGRTDCKWTRRKLRGECAWYFGFCSEDAYFLAFPGAWAGSRFAFFCFPPQPLFSHSHTKPPLPLKVLPSPFLLLSPSDLQAAGFSFIEELTLLTIFHAMSISASHIRIHVDDPPSSHPSLKAS